MKNHIPFLLVVITVLSASCSSPLDEDTPRRRTTSSNDNGQQNPPTPHPPIPAIRVTPAFGIEGGNTAGTFPWGNTANGMNGDAAVLVDTSAASPAIWINTTVLQVPSNGTWNNSVVVNSIVLHADSLVPGAPAVEFNSMPKNGTSAQIDLEEGPPGTVPQQRIIDVNGTQRTGRIQEVEHDATARIFIVTIAIDDIDLLRGGTMKMNGTLTIEY